MGLVKEDAKATDLPPRAHVRHARKYNHTKITVCAFMQFPPLLQCAQFSHSAVSGGGEKSSGVAFVRRRSHRHGELSHSIKGPQISPP